MGDSEAFSSVLPALGSNILCGVTGSNYEHILTFELSCITEVMCVSNSAGELFHAREMWGVWNTEMSRTTDYVVEYLARS